MLEKDLDAKTKKCESLKRQLEAFDDSSKDKGKIYIVCKNSLNFIPIFYR